MSAPLSPVGVELEPLPAERGEEELSLPEGFPLVLSGILAQAPSPHPPPDRPAGAWTASAEGAPTGSDASLATFLFGLDRGAGLSHLGPVDTAALFRPQERAPGALVEGAGPFAGRGLFTVNDPALAIQPGVDWIAVRPEALTPELALRARQAGIRLVVWEAKASEAGLEAVRRFGAEGYIAQAEGPDELQAALRLGDAIPVAKALVTNNFMDRWPPGWIAMPEAYSGQNPSATVERVVFDARARGASVVVPVLGLFSENGRGPTDIVQAARDLARVTVPGVAAFTVETAGSDLEVMLGRRSLRLLLEVAEEPRLAASPSPGPGTPGPSPTAPTFPSLPSPGALPSSSQHPPSPQAFESERDPLPSGAASTASEADSAEPPPSASQAPPAPVEARGLLPGQRPAQPKQQPEGRAALPVRLPELPDRVGAELRLLAREGRTEARIVLHPPELGEVRVRLVQEAAGLSATIVADASPAVDALAAAAGALRRGLESLGIPVLALDVRAPGARDAEERDGDKEAPWATPAAGQRRREAAEGETLIRATARIEGALIDVLA